MIILERKTASGDISPGAFYWARLTLDLQVSVYSLALGARVIYDVCRKLDLEPYKATPVEKRKYTKPKSRACPACKAKNPRPGPHRVVLTKSVDGPEYVCQDGRIITDPGGELYSGQRTTDETPEEYFDRCVEAIAESPEKYFQRSEIPRLEHQLVDAALDLQATAEEIDRSSFPRNTDACLSYGRPCEYFPVCTGAARISDEERYMTKESTFVGVEKLLSASSAKTFRACPRKYRYAYVERRRARSVAEELTFGTAVHNALEAGDAFSAPLVDAFADARKRAMVLGYQTRWEDSPMRIVKHEHEFRVPLKDGWVLGGRVDCVIEE